MIKHYLIAGAFAICSTSLMADELMVTPGDMPQEAINKMMENVANYNKCMMTSRFEASQSGMDVRHSAENILQYCEAGLDELKLLLTENDVNPALVEGMAKSLRSKAAKQLMNRAMSDMAAQAAALEHVDVEGNQTP